MFVEASLDKIVFMLLIKQICLLKQRREGEKINKQVESVLEQRELS